MHTGGMHVGATGRSPLTDPCTQAWRCCGDAGVKTDVTPPPRVVAMCGYTGVSTDVTPRPASVWITSPVMMRDWDEASIT